MPRIRPATVDDAPRLAAIYDPVVRGTAVSFELEPPGPVEMARRIEKVVSGFPWLVAEEGGVVVGYSYAAAFADRPAYRWSVETTVYIDGGHRGRGVGRDLYATLLELAEMWGFANAYAGTALPNPASESLHRSVGFSLIGVFPRAGHKMGEWHDVAWWHRPLSDADPPRPPAPPPESVVTALLAPR
ncbi:MAG TPA: GNAT family N-acetyltransferase [Acidimicrobiia bacterium]|nr:GNAT family N-acetyltransferase [Acidimicrobiia bacterium]